MNNLYEALEICLQDIEQGGDLEAVLFRYPDLADELRPILEASAGAKSMAVPAPSSEVVRRNRAKLLQHAAQMRESNVKPSQRIWFASLRRIAVSLAVVAVLFVSGTSLVGASSTTLPGDNLYPVKRTWEGLRLFFAFNPLERETLELEHENERLHELKELLKEGRSEEVDFNGLVTSQGGNEWVVAGVRVLISDQTERDPGITIGSPVDVKGITQGTNTILAERIRLLSSDAVLPDADDGHESEDGNENSSGPGSGEEGPRVEETETPGPENDNSGSGSETNTNENDNSNVNEDNNSNDNTGNSNDSSGSNDNSGSDDNSGGNDNGGNDNSNDSSGGNDNGNDNGSEDSQNNDNGDDSGDGDNSGTGGDSGGGGED